MVKTSILGKITFAASGLILCASISLLAQHGNTEGPVGGRITLPVPRSVRPAGGRTNSSAKQTLFLLTRNDEGDWYYSTANLEMVYGDVATFVTAFIPHDLAGERERLFKENARIDSRAAAAYRLYYAATIYRTQLICGNGRYRFTVAANVSGTEFLGVEPLTDEWTDWRESTGTPWAAVRTKVCK